GVSLVDPGGPPSAGRAGGVRFRAAAIDVGVDIASLWRRQITLSALATDLDFEMTVPGKETSGSVIFPLPDFFQVGPLRVSIGSVRVKNSHFVIRQTDPALTVEVASADVTARPTTGDLEISGRLDRAIVDAIGRHEQIDRLALDGRLSADQIRIRGMGWHWQGDSMELEGGVRRPWIGARELFLRAKGNVSLGALARVVGVDRRLDGKAEVTADITGPLSAIEVGGRVRIPQLGL